MIKKSLRKNVFRDITSTLNRFIAIFAITALGAGFFAGLKSTAPNMMETADRYYTDQRLMDFRLLSTFGFTQKDIDQLKKQPGVGQVMPTYGADVLVDLPEKTTPMRMNTLPEDLNNSSALNLPVLTEGRMPENDNECLADSAHSVAIGETIRISNTNSKAILDMMPIREYKVVGLAQSPLFIAFQRGNTNIGNGKISAFFYLPQSALTSEYYTEVFVTLSDTQGLSAFSDEYQEWVDTRQKELEAFGQKRAKARYNEIKTEANEKLADAQQKLDDAKQEAQTELDDAWQKILDGEAKLADARLELARNEQKLADGEAQLAQGEAKLASARSELEANEAKWAAGKAEYDTGKAEYDKAYQEFQTQSAAFDQAVAQLDGMLGAVDSLSAGADALGQLLPQIGENTTPEEQAAAAAFVQGATSASTTLRGMANGLTQGGMADQAALLTQAADGIDAALAAGDYATAYGILSVVPGQIRPGLEQSRKALDEKLPQLIAAQEQLLEVKTKLDAAAASLAEGRAALDSGWSQLESGTQELATARAQLEDGRRKLEDGRAQLAKAQQELEDGKKEYEDGRAEADEKIADAHAQIEEGQQELDDLKMPEWFVFTRTDNPGYSGFRADADRIDSIAVVFPVFFFLLAVMVSLTTMTRMVEEQRTQIGTLKALGFSKGAIAFKYLVYAGVASVAGAIAGVLAGSFAFPFAIWNAYQMMYQMRPVVTTPQYGLWVLSIGFSVLSTTTATLLSCYNELRSVPAELMRPKAPRPGKRILLERIPFLWQRMKFSYKVTARNLFRYKKRFIMTITGVAGCTALLLTGFGLQDSIKGIVGVQFGKINLHDVTIGLTDPSSALEDTPVNRLLRDLGTVMYQQEINTEAIHGEYTNQGTTTNLYIAENPDQLNQFIAFSNRKTGKPIPFPQGDGVVVTEKLANKLHLKVGDTFTVKTTNNGQGEVTVAGITQNYLLNYIYITPETFEKISGHPPEYKTILLNLAEGKTMENGDILHQIVDTEGVAGVVDVAQMRNQFEDMFNSLDSVILLILVSAGSLAFVVLYNLTNININERAREIATLKVLGFYKGEISAYVYRENILLTLIGILVGFGLGIPLHRFVINMAEVDELMFGQVVKPLSFLWAALFTLGATLLVNLVMRGRLNKIDMIESLKSAE